MWLKRSTYERLVSEASLALHVPKLELRAEQAEATLTKERERHTQELRHWASMFLRREKTFPLPPTEDEKAEVKVQAEQRAKQPPKLSEDQNAQLKAAIEWGRQNGFSEEEATRHFLSQLASQRSE